MADPILKISEKLTSRMERDMENIKRPLDDWSKEADKWFQQRVDISRRIGRVTFGFNVIASPVAGVILLKNMHEHPGAPTAEIIDKTQADYMDVTLEIANNIWPGTKPNTKDKAVEVVKMVAKAANIDIPLK